MNGADLVRSAGGVVGAAGTRGGHARGPALVGKEGSASFTQDRNNSHGNGRAVYVESCRCKSRFCTGCAKSLGYKTRQRVLQAVGVFRCPQLVTLTVDPKRFDWDGQRALDHVRKGEYVRKLMDALGIRAWVWVLEFQKNGMPHWHVLIGRPGGWRARLDYGLAHELWRRWGIGLHLEFSKRREGMAPEHAVMYITKYLMKPPRNGWPAWVFDLERAPRVVGASAVVREAWREDRVEPKRVDSHDQQERASSTVGERVAACGQSCRLFMESVGAFGELERRVLCEVPGTVQDLAEHQESCGIRIVPEVVHYDSGSAGVRWRVEGRRGVRLDAVADRVQAGIEASGLIAKVADRMEHRQAWIRGELEGS